MAVAEGFEPYPVTVLMRRGLQPAQTPFSPVVVSAKALPSWTSEYPSNEMAKSRPDDGAGTAPPRRLSIDDNQSLDESAEATGEWATATPMPNPTANKPSRTETTSVHHGSSPRLWPARVRRRGD
jgi:hypothetical protein